MRKMFILPILTLSLISITACGQSVNNMSVDETVNTNSGKNVLMESVEGFEPQSMYEVHREVMIKKDEPDYFLHECDRQTVANYDLKKCAFEIQNIKDDQAECVILCEKDI